MFTASLARPAPWDSIVDFITHPSYCGRRLYPRQRTAYRLIFLETEQMTDYDLEVIEGWRQGFLRRRDVFGVQPDIWERIRYLKDNGYRRFPHIQFVLGRRGSKGLMGGGLGAEQIAYFYSLDDWQAHYDIDKGQNGVLAVVATNQSQAQRFQFADVRRTVERCKYLQPHIATSKDHFFSIRTPADIRYIAELKAAKVHVEHEIASLTAIALSSSSSAGRGGVGFANFYDEMAHMVLGTGSVKSGEEIYNAWQPSLDQFAKDGLTVVPSSPFTKIGIFFKLYQDGRVLMPDYGGEWHEETERTLGIDAEEEISKISDPEMLILQLPSWGLYQDWERGPELIGKVIKRPITYSPEGDKPENVRMKRLEIKNPDKFKVERRGQFAEVEGAYLDPLAVEAMFKTPDWRPRLEAQSRGYLTHAYRIHCDPSRTNANFALAIGHTEIAPCDKCGAIAEHAERHHPCKACLQRREQLPGMHWPHVIFDLLHVWRPGDSAPDEDGRRKIDYIQVMNDIMGLLDRFPSTKKLTFDQYDSALGIAQLRKKYSPRIAIGEVLFTEKDNQRRMERFKSALNLGWMHSYRDHFYDEEAGGSLLEMEMKFLAERNGKVIKQEIGPVTTKDLFDAVSVVATELLKDSLDRWSGGDFARPAVGSSEVAGLRSGREFQRVGGSVSTAGAWLQEQLSGASENPARQMIGANRAERSRRTAYQPTRTQGARVRGVPTAMPRAGRRGR